MDVEEDDVWGELEIGRQHRQSTDSSKTCPPYLSPHARLRSRTRMLTHDHGILPRQPLRVCKRGAGHILNVYEILPVSHHISIKTFGDYNRSVPLGASTIHNACRELQTGCEGASCMSMKFYQYQIKINRSVPLDATIIHNACRECIRMRAKGTRVGAELSPHNIWVLVEERQAE